LDASVPDLIPIPGDSSAIRMRRLSFYILRQILGPALLFTVLLAMVVWMTQSLRLLDLVINRGQSAGIFLYLSLLVLPSLLVVIIPIAFFAGALYTLNKLHNDSELVVMWSAGISRAQLAMPVLMAAVVAMACTYACSLYLMPTGERTMRDKVYDIRADLGSAILREGAFTTPSKGLTVFIREIAPNGEIRGILVHDNRDAARPVTYLAESGVLAKTPDGPRLIMRNGDIERGEDNGARLSLLKFDRYVFDLDQFAGPERASDHDSSELYLPQLLDPDSVGEKNPVLRGVYFAEAHNRISGPLYCLAFALIALAATAKGHMARKSYALRLTAAAVAGGVLRLVGYGAQGLAARSPEWIALLYLFPLIGMAAGAAVLGDVNLVPEGLRRFGRLRAGEATP
jgi:lipopolysaccharide export system permease protein